MKKYQFKLNGKVVSAKELYSLVNYIDDRDDAESILGDLLQGKVVTLYEFTSDLFIDYLQLVEVKENKEMLE